MKLFTVFLLSSLTSVQAASWYAGASGAGAANGTSWANQWAIGSVVWGSGGVVAGDTLYLDGGSTSQTYTSGFTIGASGTAGNPITVRVGQDVGHNGKVVIDLNALGDSATANGITIGGHYVTLEGSVGGVSKFEINNLRNTSNRTGCYSVFADGKTNVIVRMLTQTNVNNPVKLQYGTNLEVSSNHFTFRGDAGVSTLVSTGGFDVNLISRNTLIVMNGTTGGPDGVQPGPGTTIYGNTFALTNVAYVTSDQHPDYVQVAGDFIKTVSNTFIDIGDSGIDFDGFANTSPNDMWIDNNVFRIDNAVDPFPEFIRFYTSSTALVSFTNVKIRNNIFANNTGWSSIKFMQYGGGNPTATGCEIKNNIFYNCGNGNSFPMLYIEGSTGFTAADWDTDANVWYRSSGTQYVTMDGTSITVSAWIAANEPNGSTSLPSFTNAGANDFSLQSGDTVAKDAGVTISDFSTDFLGVSRPQGSAWDKGPYEYSSGAGSTPGIRSNPAAVFFQGL